jgi:hypothetical protein
MKNCPLVIFSVFLFTNCDVSKKIIETENHRPDNSSKAWMLDTTVLLKNSAMAYEQDVVDAIVDIDVPPSDPGHLNDQIVIARFANQDSVNGYLFELKNETTGELFVVTPTASEVAEGQWERIATLKGFEGNLLKFKVNYPDLKRKGLLLSDSYWERSNPQPHIRIRKPVDNQWKGKKIVWLGTSIPENTINSMGYRASYPVMIGRMLGANMVNNARGGLSVHLDRDGTIRKNGTLTAYLNEYQNPKLNNEAAQYTRNRDIYRSFENSLLGQSADLYVFDVSANNLDHSNREWDNFDFVKWQYKDNTSFDQNRYTFLGSLLFLTDKLRKDNPNARMLLVTEFQKDFPGVIDAEAFSKQFNIPHFNVWEQISSTQNKSLYILQDDVHPTQLGQAQLAEYLLANFIELK